MFVCGKQHVFELQNPSVLKKLSNSQSSGAHSVFTAFLSSCQAELSFFDWQLLLHPSEEEKEIYDSSWVSEADTGLLMCYQKGAKEGRKKGQFDFFCSANILCAHTVGVNPQQAKAQALKFFLSGAAQKHWIDKRADIMLYTYTAPQPLYHLLNHLSH